MNSERKTLFELAPDSFILPGKSTNGSEPLAGIVFERDKSAPGVLYRAKIEPSDLGLETSAHPDISDDQHAGG